MVTRVLNPLSSPKRHTTNTICQNILQTYLLGVGVTQITANHETLFIICHVEFFSFFLFFFRWAYRPSPSIVKWTWTIFDKIFYKTFPRSYWYMGNIPFNVIHITLLWVWIMLWGSRPIKNLRKKWSWTQVFVWEAESASLWFVKGEDKTPSQVHRHTNSPPTLNGAGYHRTIPIIKGHF